MSKYHPSKLQLFLAAFTWMLIISSFSSTHFSASKTAPIIEDWLHTLIPSLSTSTIHFIHVMIRKFAHFSEFSIFTILVFGIFTIKKTLWRLHWLVYTLIIVICLALLDEYHQAFVRNRNASLEDSLVDITGGIACLLLIWLVKRDKFKV